jgi:hypothetical protein
MDDERIPHDVDRRVRAALAIDDAVTRRVLAHALKAPIERAPRGRRVTSVAVAATVAICLVVGIGVWRRWRDAPAPASPATLRISAKGVLLVVEGQDGRRWVVGPPPARPTGGNYVLVVPQ